MHGYGVIAAWEIGQLDEATIEALLTVRTEMRQASNDAATVEAVKNRIRAQHQGR